LRIENREQRTALFQSRSKSRIGRPVSGVSLAFLTASWNFLSSNSEACFCASTDCRKIDSRRLSCSFMARAASSMSLNILGFTAAVWAITAAVAVSIFSSALQQGQVTSIVTGLFAILRMIPQKLPKRVRQGGKFPEVRLSAEV